MEINTSQFGEISVNQNKIIEFAREILGFEGYTKFTIIDNLEDEIFYWLQSVEDPDLAFMMIDPTEFIADYKIDIPAKFREKIKLKTKQEMVVYTLVVIQEEKNYVSTNLKAPIIINHKQQKGGQLVLETDYPTRYYLMKKGENQEVMG